MVKCVVHGYHYPNITVPDVHHIWPKEFGGPDIPSNKVTVCPTGHRNIHEYINASLHGRPLPKVTKKEKEYAKIGLNQINSR